jgi:hypothetical protein
MLVLSKDGCVSPVGLSRQWDIWSCCSGEVRAADMQIRGEKMKVTQGFLASRKDTTRRETKDEQSVRGREKGEKPALRTEVCSRFGKRKSGEENIVRREWPTGPHAGDNDKSFI